MLDTFRKGQRWLTGIFIFVIGGVFVFFLGLGGPLAPNQPSGQAVVEVGDITVSRADYQRERQRQESRYSEALGDQFDRKTAAAFLDSQTMRILVDSAVMSHAAQALGLMVTRSEIQDYLRGAQQFRGEDGRFAVDAFEDWVEYNFGSQRNFMALMRRDLLRAKLHRLIFNQPTVTDEEARIAALHRLESIKLGYVSLDTGSLPPSQVLADEIVESYLAENEADVRAVYDERADKYREPEARKARHILFAVEREADPEALAAAQENAEDSMQQILDGAAFEDVALELSEDEGSRAKGGDIGYVVRGGETAPELEEAVYGSEPGGEMRVVQTNSGFHVVRVDELREASLIAFEEVGRELARELAGKQKAKEFAEAQADEIASQVRSGSSLEAAAHALGVEYELSPPVRRRVDGHMPEVGTSIDMMATAFSLSEEDPTSPRVFAVGDRRVLVELIERQALDLDVLENAVQNEKETLLTQKRETMLQTWLERHRETLSANNQLLIDSSITTGS